MEAKAAKRYANTGGGATGKEVKKKKQPLNSF